MTIVIVGAGIIGSATAFYLTEEPSQISPSSIHVIESSPELFASASGYAAGFLAKDWFSPASSSLGELSFDLHRDLAKKYGGPKEWGYSRSISTSLSRDLKSGARDEDWLLEGSRADAAGEIHQLNATNYPSWLKRFNGDEIDIIGEDDTAAQVDPLRLSKFLLKRSLERGVHLHQASTPVSIHLSADGRPESLELASSTSPSSPTIHIPCTSLIIAAGAWTPQIYKTIFPNDATRIPITQLAGYSILLRTPRWKADDELSIPTNTATTPSSSARGGRGCHAVFTTATGPDGRGDWSPEIFSRAGGEIYIAGLNDSSIPLPRLATERVLKPEKVAIVLDEAKRLVGVDEGTELEVLREGLCFRPVTRKGTPIVAQAREGVWIAAGHGPWGISLSLGTGKVMSEMVTDQKLSADVRGLGL